MQRKMASILLVGLFQFNCCGGPYEKLVADFKTPTEENHLFCYDTNRRQEPSVRAAGAWI